MSVDNVNPVEEITTDMCEESTCCLETGFCPEPNPCFIDKFAYTYVQEDVVLRRGVIRAVITYPMKAGDIVFAGSNGCGRCYLIKKRNKKKNYDGNHIIYLVGTNNRELELSDVDLINLNKRLYLR